MCSLVLSTELSRQHIHSEVQSVFVPRMGLPSSTFEAFLDWQVLVRCGRGEQPIQRRMFGYMLASCISVRFEPHLLECRWCMLRGTVVPTQSE